MGMRPIDADAYAAEMRIRQNECFERMNRQCKGVITEREHWAGIFATFTEAKLTMDAMPTVIPGNWHHAEEELPTYEDRFLTVTNISGVWIYELLYYDTEENSWYKWGDDSLTKKINISRVDRWMELPRPPMEARR